MGVVTSFESTFAQSDDDVNKNVIGQEGNGNESSQSDEKNQNSNQNSMCVSGESVSLSCNNLSAKNIDTIVHSNDDEGEQPGPDMTVNQIIVILDPNDRFPGGWVPDGQKTAFEINLYNLVGISDNHNPDTPLRNIDFQVHWQKRDIILTQYDECKVNQLKLNYIDIECDVAPPDSDSFLTIVATSTEPIKP